MRTDERRIMSQHMRSTDVKLSQCSRCNSYVWACEVAGFKTAADPAPLGQPDYVQALLGGRTLYRLLTVAGKPSRLIHTQTWAEDSTILAEHVCTAEHASTTRTMNVKAVEVVAEGPQRGSVRPGSAQGGFPHAPAPVVAPRAAQTPSRPSPVQPATPRRSSTMCDTCSKPVEHTQADTVMIEHGATVIYARHEECT